MTLVPELDSRRWALALAFVLLVYLHNALPYLTTMPRVNVDEPWLMERAYQVLHSGIPSQPMLGLHHAYFLQVGYGYLLALWMRLFGVGLFQARLLGVVLGLGIVWMVATIGRRTIDAIAGLSAALFLALDSNFLGGVRNARTDIPSVFFVTAALTAYVIGRQRVRTRWFVASGACVGLAVLCHGNAFWVGVILALWFLFDYGRRAPVLPFGYGFLGGLLLTLGPYLAVVWTRWVDVSLQINNFAGDRVPGWRPAFVLHQMTLEIDRYRNWYFGLVTNLVPHPLLWTFQAATIVGAVALVGRMWRVRPMTDPRGAPDLLILAAGSAFIFAGFINNKVPVYLPHLLIGFSLAAGFAVSEAARFAHQLASRTWTGPRAGRFASAAIAMFLLGYAAAGVGYYEKWYASTRRSELVPYEATAATLRVLVPAGPKYLFASPHFWPPFHDESSTTFYSYAAAHPVASGAAATLAGVADDRPIYLVVDESQWLPVLTETASQMTTEWQQAWVQFIERKCSLDALALGTAYGTLALYQCALGGNAPPAPAAPRIVGGATEYVVGDLALAQTAEDLARWARYEDPRRSAASRPEVRLTNQGLRISGTGWPGIVKMFNADPGQKYLLRMATANTRDADILYLGTWQRPEVQSLAGASSAGIPAPLLRQPWFPHDRAFIATAPQVRMLVYSEAPTTDFAIASLDVFRLMPLAHPRATP